MSVKKGLIGTTNATKEENLGPVEYAHLRAPLPEDLSNSEIFAPQEGQPHPQTYFLMVSDVIDAMRAMLMTVAPQQGRLRIGNWYVQDCFSLGKNGRRESRTRVPENARLHKSRRHCRKRVGGSRIR